MLTVTDLFCGGGGSSTGLTQVPGFEVKMAANHWPLAVEVHNRNHPTSDHAAVDLHKEDPRYFPRTDILWASPECTKWSQANGSRPLPAIEEGLFEDPLSDDAATRSRLLMFDVLRFAEHHRYRAMIVENVVDIHLEAGGNQYDASDPKHPSYGDPNSYYRAWSVDEYLRVLHTAESKALAVPVEGRDGKEARPLGLPGRTQTTRSETAVVTPLHVSLMGGHDHAVEHAARPVDRELRTLTAEGNNDYLLAPYYGSSDTAKPVDQPVGTLTTRDRYALIMRNNTARGDQGQMSTPAHEVLRTLTTAGHQSLLTPGDLEAAETQVDDCLFRMLEPHEVAAGMAFPADYLWDGTRRERVRLAGNAVTPPAARDLGAVLVETLGGAA